jgi:hypothetical protein
MLSLAQWLVDRGFYSFVLLLYLEQEHSKMDCDAVFGVLKQTWKHATLLSFECLGRAAAQSPRTAPPDKKYQVINLNSETMSNCTATRTRWSALGLSWSTKPVLGTAGQ